MIRNFILVLCTCYCISSMCNTLGQPLGIDFNVSIIREGIKGHPKPRTPIKCPSASIEGHTLYINDCDGCMLQLLGENGIVYSTIIVDSIAELPEDLTGIYELQVIRGNYCFWAEVEL